MKSLLPIVCLALMFAGCRSNKAPASANGAPGVADATECGPPVPALIRDMIVYADAPAAFPAALPPMITTAPKPAPVSPPPPSASLTSTIVNARNLNINLTHGTRVAYVDGIQVYLSRNAVYDAKSKRTVPSEIDNLTAISPLANAHTKPFVTTRPMRVFIDPGHGGQDPGASTTDKRHTESATVLPIATQLARNLERAGFEVMMSRYDNIKTQTLDDRAKKANDWKADIFVSIHMNYNNSPEPNGAETYILTPAGELSTMDDGKTKPGNGAAAVTGNANDVRNARLGFAIQRRLIGATNMQDRGLRRARFAVLRETKMPAVLVECGFLTSKGDLALVTSADGRDKIAQSIFEGICDYALGNLGAKQVDYPLGKPLPNLPWKLKVEN
ncbi:MAG: N-acetylmuramoyl-L-alanine amidase [Kiritimatiellaeota bacterium]|nr:N-acetylmuramoyl-L-alanine amidase [Kiritimatiellota bacterium]